MKLLSRSSRRFTSRRDYTYPQRSPDLRVTRRAELAITGTAPRRAADREDRRESAS